MIVSSSCNIESRQQELFAVEIISQGIDCGDTYIILFNERDEEEFTHLIGVDNIVSFPRFYALNLPVEYKHEGLNLNIKVKNPEASEDIACKTLGPAYNHIIILEASIPAD